MAESMLAILCHILRGEPIIQERLSKEREGTARPDEESSSTSAGGTSSSSGTGGVVGEGAPGSANGSSAGGSTEEGSNSTTRREPQVNQAQLTQVTSLPVVGPYEVCYIFFPQILFISPIKILIIN